MKKILYILLIPAFMLAFQACNNNDKTDLTGKWKVESFKIKNIDDLSKSLFEQQKTIVEEQIKQLENQLNSTENDVEKQMYEKTINELKKRLESFSAEKLKEQIESKYSSLKNITIVFNEDNTLERSYGEESMLGTWEMSANNTVLTMKFDGSKPEVYKIINSDNDKIGLEIHDKTDKIDAIIYIELKRENK